MDIGRKWNYLKKILIENKRKRVRSTALRAFSLWHSGLRIQVQQLRLLRRDRTNPRHSGLKDLVFLVAAVARIQPQAWELSYATAIKKKKKYRSEFL